MLLPVNIRKFVISILKFTVNSIFGSSHSRVFLLIIVIHFRYTYFRYSRGELISRKAADVMSLVLLNVDSFRDASHVFSLDLYLFCEQSFLGNCW